MSVSSSAIIDVKTITFKKSGYYRISGRIAHHTINDNTVLSLCRARKSNNSNTYTAVEKYGLRLPTLPSNSNVNHFSFSEVIWFDAGDAMSINNESFGLGTDIFCYKASDLWSSITIEFLTKDK